MKREKERREPRRGAAERVAAPDAPPSLRLLGGFEVRSAAGETVPLAARKPAALLAYLALHAGAAVPRDKLATLLWEDRAQAQARGSLRQALTVLRKLVPTGLAAAAESVTLQREALSVDALTFRRLVEAGDADALEGAVELYRGDLLDGFHAGAPLFEEWLLGEREVLRQRALESLSALLARQRLAGDRPRAIRTAVRLLSLDPLQEEVHRALMQLHAEAGQRGAALRQYGICRDVLRAELGVGVEPATEALHAAIRAARVAPIGGAALAVEVGDADAEAEPAAAELRQVTALSAAIAPASGRRSAESEHRAATLLRTAAEACVGRFGGCLVGVLGGAVTAVFGVRRARSRDTELALRAGLALRDEVAAGDQAAGLRVGIAAGQVMVEPGAGAAAPRLAGAALSDAAALQAAAGAGEILVSAAVQRSLAARLVGEPVETRGGAAWRVQALGDARGGLQFVGRRVEQRLLDGALAVCAEEGRGHGFLVRGEAGIGKTRLVEELAREAAGQGFAVQRGQILDFGVGAGQDAIGTVVCGLLGLAPRPDGAARAAAAAAAVRDGALEPAQRPFLNDLLALPQPDDLRGLYEAMDDRARAGGRATVLARLVEAASAARPQLLVIDDVHWADGATLAGVAALLDAVTQSRAVLVLTARPAEEPAQAPWRATRLRVPFSVIELAPLRDDEARAVAAQFDDLPAEVAEECVRRAGGNALFLEQLLRGAAAGERTVPDSVRSIVLARADGLDGVDRRALHAASVVGQRCELATLRHVLERPDYAPDALVDRGLLDADGDQLRFVHALVHEAVYGSLLEVERAALHRRAAAWFAARDPVLHAEQLERAGDAETARAYLRAAEHEAAQYHPERALRLAQRGAALAADDALRQALLGAQGDRLLDLGRATDALAVFERARALGGDTAAHCRSLIGVAACLRLLERHGEAQAALAEAQTLAAGDGLEAALASIHYLRGCIAFPLGDLDGCRREHEAALALARRIRSPLDEARALSGLADAHYLRGHMRTAHQHFDRCIALARRHAFGRIEVSNLHMRGVTLLYQCDGDAALAAVEEAIARTRLIADPRAEMVARSCACDVLLWSGDWPRLAAAAAPCTALARELGAANFEAEGLFCEGYAAARLGRLAEGRRWIEQARRRCFPAGAAFLGPTILGGIAVLTADAAERERALAEGERLLAAGSVSHNHLSFRPLAMEAALAAGELDRVEHHAAALERYTADEPLPWSAFFAAWGRALAAHARGAADRAELARLADEARAAGLGFALPRLAAAL